MSALKMSQNDLLVSFKACQNKEEMYHLIMEWGKKLPPFDPAWKTEENRVEGCQSLLYLHTVLKEDRLFFYADSDALISRGLAALLVIYYSDKTATEILAHSPTVFAEMGIFEALTPGRANGFASLYKRIKQDAHISSLRKATSFQSEETIPSFPKISIVKTNVE